jgi:hypothetical protein
MKIFGGNDTCLPASSEPPHPPPMLASEGIKVDPSKDVSMRNPPVQRAEVPCLGPFQHYSNTPWFLTLFAQHRTAPVSSFTRAIGIWILKYPVQAFSDQVLNNLLSSKDLIRPLGPKKLWGIIQTNRRETFYPCKRWIRRQELRFMTQ